jgi:hypothetical protein
LVTIDVVGWTAGGPAVGLPPQPRDAGGWWAGPEGWNTGGQGHHHCCRRTLGGDRREVGATGGGGRALSSRIIKLSKKSRIRNPLRKKYDWQTSIGGDGAESTRLPHCFSILKYYFIILN